MKSGVHCDLERLVSFGASSSTPSMSCTNKSSDWKSEDKDIEDDNFEIKEEKRMINEMKKKDKNKLIKKKYNG